MKIIIYLFFSSDDEKKSSVRNRYYSIYIYIPCFFEGFSLLLFLFLFISSRIQDGIISNRRRSIQSYFGIYRETITGETMSRPSLERKRYFGNTNNFFRCIYYMRDKFTGTGIIPGGVGRNTRNTEGEASRECHESSS